MHRVVVLALDGVYPFELGIPGRVFGSADGLYDVITCTVDGRSVRTIAGFDISTEHGPEALSAADTVVIPPFRTSLPLPDGLPSAVYAALDRIPTGARIVSICTASVLLASAGLLDGRPATTHWQEAPSFQRQFPRVHWNPDVLFVDDGDVLTSAGAASGIDLCLHLVRKDHGSEVANRVARTCVVPPWREGGQAQYIEQPLPEPSSTGTAPTRAWAVRHLDRQLTLADLATHAHMSARTFARRFQAEVGMGPGRWLIDQRVARARELLESTDHSVNQIASEVGYSTTASLRQHLYAAIGVAPLTYRRTFQTASG